MQRSRFLFPPRWSGSAGVKEVLIISLPLIMSGLSVVLNLFFDRTFLAEYDVELHMTASMSAGVTWWASQQIFNGIVSYVGTFVAQYYGANRFDRIGPIMWQSIYTSLLGTVFIWMIFPLVKMIFLYFHGDTEFAHLEIKYCFILNIGVLFLLFNTAMNSLFASLGRPYVVMIVGFAIALINIVMNRWLIFNPPDWLPFIKEGLEGAAWATSFSFLCGSIIFAALALQPSFARRYHLLSGWRFEWLGFSRLIKFGFPHGAGHFAEVGAFAFFMIALGNLDAMALAAANIAFTVNNIVFVPIMTMSQAMSILVGQYVGKKDIEGAERATFSGALIGLSSVTLLALSYVLFPEFYIGFFRDESQAPEVIIPIANLAKLYLLYMAAYCIGDIFGFVYSGALKGAGDTRYCMFVVFISSFCFLIVPNLLTITYKWPPWVLFLAIGVHIYFMALCYLVRYYFAKWKDMTVMEPNLIVEEEGLTSLP